MNELQNTAKRRRLTAATWALMIASPFLLLAILTVLTGKNQFAGVPVWSDELDYWRAVFSWANVGTNTGYNGMGELIPKVGTLSVHGFTPLLLYGLYGKLIDWSFSSIVLCNCLWVSAGALCYVALNRPKAKTALLLSLGLMAYAPLVIYAATSMTELANYGLLLFYLAFLVRLASTRRKNGALEPVSSPEAPQPWRGGLPSMALCAATVVLCCLYRITYCVLFVPLIVVACDYRWSGKMLLGAMAALLTSLFVYYVSAMYTSPYAAGFLYNFMRAGSFDMALKMFLSHAKANLFDYFLRHSESYMEIGQRWLYCGAMVLTLASTFVRMEKQDGRLRVHTGFDGISLLSFGMLFVPFAIVVCLYETNDWSDYRTLAPFLWAVVAVLMIRGRKLIPTAYLAGCAAMLVVLCTVGQPCGGFGIDNRFEETPFSEEVAELCSVIEYDPTAQNPFTNTIRIDLYNLQTVASVNPGMGMEGGWFTEDTTGKSRWILTDHLKIPVSGYEQVLKNGAGKVYRLVDSYEDD